MVTLFFEIFYQKLLNILHSRCIKIIDFNKILIHDATVIHD